MEEMALVGVPLELPQEAEGGEGNEIDAESAKALLYPDASKAMHAHATVDCWSFS